MTNWRERTQPIQVAHASVTPKHFCKAPGNSLATFRSPAVK